MGNMCSGDNSASSKNATVSAAPQQMMITKLDSERKQEDVAPVLKENRGKVWAGIILSDEIQISNVHKCKLLKWKEEDHPVQEKLLHSRREDEDDYDEEYDPRDWLCNGSQMLEGGCLSGQTDFARQDANGRWQCPDEACDFDICDMCIRWLIHCQKNKLPTGWTKEEHLKRTAEEEAAERAAEEEERGDEPYETPRK